jgi:hypothetical protein
MALNHLQYNTSYLLNARNEAEPLNDALSYGVRIVEADVAEGQVYWKVLGVHHLLPRENFSKHNIYLEALNENGDRITNPPAYAGWTWEGRRPNEPANPVPLDKPANETAGDISVHFGQVVSVWLKGVGPDSQDKSDRVENLHTAHPDEPLPDGSLLNTLGHHSFYIVFQRTRKESITEGVIAGQVERGQGQTLRLLRNNQVVAQQTIGNDGAYHFDNLSLGSYRLEVANTGVSQDNIRLEANNKSLTVNLALPLPTSSVIAGRIQNGQGRMLLLIKEGNIIARVPLSPSGEFRFENLGAGLYTLMVFETNVRQDNIALDGSNSREVNLTIPDASTTPETAEKVINHYLLFGPSETRGRQTNLLLAVDYILHFSVTVGFNVTEAKQARHVTIIGEGISQADQQVLRDAGSEVEVMSGDSYQIEAELTARLRAGRAFG